MSYSPLLFFQLIDLPIIFQGGEGRRLDRTSPRSHSQSASRATSSDVGAGGRVVLGCAMERLNA